MRMRKPQNASSPPQQTVSRLPSGSRLPDVRVQGARQDSPVPGGVSVGGEHVRSGR